MNSIREIRQDFRSEASPLGLLNSSFLIPNFSFLIITAMHYEEPYKRNPKKKNRQPRRRRQTLGAWLAGVCLRLFALILAIALLGGALLYFLPVSLLAVEPEGVALSLTDGLPEDVANVLLLGLDATHENTRRSDSIIIASIGRGRLQLTSVLRDTLLAIPDRGTGKLNAAYAYGGPWLAMRTLNENFRLNLIHYAAVDFVALAEIVDAVGGVDIDITEAEMTQINRNVVLSRFVFQPLGYTAKRSWMHCRRPAPSRATPWVP